MVNANDVYGKIKEMSQRMLGSHPRILLTDISADLSVSQDMLLVLLTELENRGLIKIHKTMAVSVSLTNYGVSQEDVSGGLSS